MRPCLFISTIFVSTLFFGFRSLTYPVEITGHIKKNPKDTSAYVEHLTVFVKGGRKILAKALTDDKGNFRLSFTPMKEKSFDFFCTGIGIDTLLIESVTTFDSDEVEMTFYVPGKVKTNALGKVICPKCKRTDKVYEIQYGDNPISVRHISSSGDTTYSRIYKGKYYEDCEVRPAKYYCDRDKIKF